VCLVHRASIVFLVTFTRLLLGIRTSTAVATAPTQPTGSLPTEKEDQESHGYEEEDEQACECPLPVLIHPEDELRVPVVPTAFSAVVEEGCCDLASQHVACCVVVFVRKYVEFVFLQFVLIVAHVAHPYIGDEHAAR
jgi:hypothetical protein